MKLTESYERRQLRLDVEKESSRSGTTVRLYRKLDVHGDDEEILYRGDAKGLVIFADDIAQLSQAAVKFDQVEVPRA